MNLDQPFRRYLAPTTDTPIALTFAKAKGIYIFDLEGNKYMDMISGIGVANIGHSHPSVIAAVHKQVDSHMHLMVYGEYIQQKQVTYAESLSKVLSQKLQCIYWVNSGTEATEGAFKLAKRTTGRSEIISFKGSYHGSTLGSLSAMGNEKFKRAFRPLVPGHRQLIYNDLKHLDEITTNTAAVIVECIQAGSGYIQGTKEFLRKLSKICSEKGAMLIIDECQTGFGRTGELFAHQLYGVNPDILCLGKALGGGLPLGAFISSQANMKKLSREPMLGHITTFGGNPVSCAAGQAAFEVLINSGWMDLVTTLGDYIRRALIKHPRIININGQGLLIALVLDSPNSAIRIQKKLISRRIITNFFLFNDSALRLTPPICIKKAELNHFIKNIIEALDEL
ncbi:MAG: [LysW]-aminoadipate semialdehyde transaminase [Owenweeksia sp. TMED14]|nr:MAG: [LysW]-aminoadipate semialdehyde transaminase [Owenweeksia sp. TMED14]